MAYVSLEERWIPILEATGIRFRFNSRSTGNPQVFPSSNLRPWTPEEQATIEAAVREAGCDVTYKMLAAAGHYVSEYTAKPGFGFRIFKPWA